MSTKTNKKQEPKKNYKRVPRTDFVGAYTPFGDKKIRLAELSVKDGQNIAEPGKEIDWDAYIQANKESCDLHNIVARYLNGDASVVNVGNPLSGDLASMPHNVNEIQDLAERVKIGYDEFSDEVKAIFGGSFEKFYDAVLSNSVEQQINAYAEAKYQQAKKDAEAAAKIAQEKAKAETEGDK